MCAENNGNTLHASGNQMLLNGVWDFFNQNNCWDGAIADSAATNAQSATASVSLSFQATAKQAVDTSCDISHIQYGRHYCAGFYPRVATGYRQS
jgi:hypothetical protein